MQLLYAAINMPDLQRLQTIVATNDAIPILKALPRDLHPYIYRFIADDVKVQYWMDKYNWTDTIHVIGEYYCGLHLIFAYFHHLKLGEDDLSDFLHNAGAYREKDKFRDVQGRVICVEWSWIDDNCDYDAIYDRLGGMIYGQYETRHNMNGLYKLLSHLLTLWDDAEKNLE